MNDGASRPSRLDAALLYLVTPGEPRAGALDEFLPRVLEAGVDIVQLREKGLGARPLLRLAAVARRRTTEFGELFIVNDRVDLALAAGADGVHVGQEDIPPGEARRQMGPEALIGLSTHSEEQVLAASPEADYIAVGPVLPTPTKPGRPAVGPGLVPLPRPRPAGLAATGASETKSIVKPDIAASTSTAPRPEPSNRPASASALPAIND